MKNGLPETSLITLKSNPDQWKLFVKNLIGELKFEVLIETDDKRTLRTEVNIHHIFSPEMQGISSSVEIRTNIEELRIGMKRIETFRAKLLGDTCWLLIGEIGFTKKAPIIIFYYEAIDKAIYTIKLKEDTLEDFLPAGVILSPEDEDE